MADTFKFHDEFADDRNFSSDIHLEEDAETLDKQQKARKLLEEKLEKKRLKEELDDELEDEFDWDNVDI